MPSQQRPGFSQDAKRDCLEFEGGCGKAKEKETKGGKGGESHTALWYYPLHIVSGEGECWDWFWIVLYISESLCRSEASANYTGPLMCPTCSPNCWQQLCHFAHWSSRSQAIVGWWLMLVIRNPLWQGLLLRDMPWIGSTTLATKQPLAEGLYIHTTYLDKFIDSDMK